MKNSDKPAIPLVALAFSQVKKIYVEHILDRRAEVKSESETRRKS